MYVCRAGLYKQMAELKALVSEYREDPSANAALKVWIHACSGAAAAPASGFTTALCMVQFHNPNARGFPSCGYKLAVLITHT